MEWKKRKRISRNREFDPKDWAAAARVERPWAIEIAWCIHPNDLRVRMTASHGWKNRHEPAPHHSAVTLLWLN
jgi:hypothetical protein